MADTKPDPELLLDLRGDVERVRQFIASATDHCAQQIPGDPVRGVEIFYGLEHGFVRVSFFTRPDYKPFYSYEGRRYSDVVRLPHWTEFFQRWFDVPARAIFPDGSVLRTRPGHNPVLNIATAEGGLGVVKALGFGLGRVLTDMRAAGAFRGLPEASPFIVAVTDEADFWWSSDGSNTGI
jgi:hypothetical protein